MNDEAIQLGVVSLFGGHGSYVYFVEVVENGINLHKVPANTRRQGTYFFIPTEIEKELASVLSKRMRDKLIAAGVRNLQVFGYGAANKDNILTDEVFSAFFLSMLKDNKGKGADEAIDSLIAEIESKPSPTLTDKEG